MDDTEVWDGYDDEDGADVYVAGRQQRRLPVPEHVLDCVVKVYAVHCEPNYALPWAMTPQKQSVATGFIISGRRIITNAHAIEHHTVVMLKRRRSDVKYRAKVVAVGHDCDIALLHVTDNRFWDEHVADARCYEQRDRTTSGNGIYRSHNNVWGAGGSATSLQTSRALGLNKSAIDHTADLVHDDCEDHPYLDPGGFTALNDYCIVIGYPIPGENISITAGVCSRVEMQVQ